MMRVRCEYNDIASLPDNMREYIGNNIKLDEAIQELDIGNIYDVFLLEIWNDNRIWYFINSIPTNEFPNAYPAELFSVTDSSIPENWSMKLSESSGRVTFRKIGFSEWVNDDSFFEKIIDGEIDSRSLYREWCLSMMSC